MSGTSIDIRIDELTSEVRSLKSMMAKLVKLNARLVERLKGKETTELDYSDVTPEELMMMASQVFNVTSAYDPDDDLISPDAIKPVDWSGYAQNNKH